MQQEIDRIRSKKTFLIRIGNLSLDRYYERKFRKRGSIHEHAVLVDASRQTDVVPGPQPDTLRIHVIESDPTMAAAMANELAAIPAKALEYANFPMRSSVIQPATVPLGPDRSFAIVMGMAVLLGSTFEAGLTGGVVWVCLELRHRREAG